ncbi:hypothetical protein E9840_05805 [Tissierella creatinini]|nr:hypothetical protein E9840_05805 [Tissierella creatinini]TJX60682.1 hypothetical protein E8P77_19810 [Soehngenia saccharolytica]
MLTKDMIILNIVADYPTTEDIFRTYDEIAGKCTMCHNLFDTLEEFSLMYKIDLDDLIGKLEKGLSK